MVPYRRSFHSSHMDKAKLICVPHIVIYGSQEGRTFMYMSALTGQRVCGWLGTLPLTVYVRVCGWLWTIPLTVIQGKSLPCQPFFLKFSIWTWPTFRLSRLFNKKICYKLLNKVSSTSKCSMSGTLLLSLLLLVSSVILHTKKLSHKNLEETLVARQWVFPNHTLRTTGKTTVMQRFCVKQCFPNGPISHHSCLLC